MASPFPGMDPYVEDSGIWPGFHHSLAEEFKAQINARVDPKYYADVNVRTVTQEVMISMLRTAYPDVGVLTQPLREPSAVAEAVMDIAPAPIHRIALVGEQIKLRTVEVRRSEDDQLVTAIEILSPYNKRPGDGLKDYLDKRLRLLRSDVHLMEIDLLRGGERPGPEVNDPPLDADYVLLVNRNRGSDVRVSDIWPISLNEPLPVLPVPLLLPDPDVPLDMTAALRTVYERAAYSRRIDYRRPTPPPELRPAMREWLAQYLPEVGQHAR